MTTGPDTAAPDRVVDPTATARRFEAFEAYRGLAAVAVVVFHVYQFTGEPYAQKPPAGLVLHDLDTLVDLFFVLSAFLLTLPWVRSSRAAERRSGRAYVVARAVRILPLYWVAITVVWALRNGSFPGDWRDLLEHLTFTQVYDSKRIFYTIGPAWSLSVEVTFYAALLLAGIAIGRLRPGPRGALVAWTAFGVGLVATGLTWKAVEVADHVSYTRWAVWFGPLAKADVFGVGVLLAVAVAVLVDRGVTAPPAVTAGLRVAGLVAVVVCWEFRGPFGQPGDEWVHPLVAVAVALVLAGSALAGVGSRYEAALGSRVPATIGLVSYSTYLWHEPLLLLL
ncbi:MAG TPA: acyltransferase, partial [Acidimicrobiales bacterium]|nr:acyltransferase [Acidimicrobiales bacterium]